MDIVANTIVCEVDAHDRSRQIMRSATNETCRHDAPRERRRANLYLAREHVSFVTRKESSDKATCAMQYSSSWIDRSTVPQSRTRSSISAQRLEIREGLGLAMLKASVWIAQANGQGFEGVSASKGLRSPLPDRFESVRRSRKTERKQRVVIVAVARYNELSSSGDTQRN